MTQIRHDFDGTTGIVTEIELTAEEIAEREAEELAFQELRSTQEAQKTAAREAVLAKLGLTAEELAAALA